MLINYRKEVYHLNLFTGSFLIFLVLIIFSCEKLELNRITKIQTGSVTDTTSISCTAQGSVIDIEEAGITQHGHCWSVTANPETNNSKTELGSRSSKGSFTSSLTGLTANTTYHVRAYATSSAGTTYGLAQTFKTLTNPTSTATTNAATNITLTNATLNGTVNANGQSTTVTFEYGTTTSYGSTITASQSPVSGSTNTSVSANISGLTESTTYHFRVKAESTAGTTYGEDQEFTTTTLSTPTATTNAATDVAVTTATLNGTVNANGHSTTVTFEYGTTTGYGSTVTASQSPVSGNINANVSADISGLTSNTTYLFRVKAVSTAGTTYGSDQEFITTAATTTVTDIDGNVYNIVQIGTQIWMKENLKTTRYADGKAIPLVEETSAWDVLGYTDKAYCYYNNSTINRDVYGALYNWTAAMNGAASGNGNPSGVQGVCPDGWHLPSDAEWTELTDYFGGESIAGGKLKETGYTHWYIPNTGADNSSGFTALPAGLRDNDGIFHNLGINAYFWSSTEGDSFYVWSRMLHYDFSDVYPYGYSKHDGFSVRCIRD